MDILKFNFKIIEGIIFIFLFVFMTSTQAASTCSTYLKPKANSNKLIDEILKLDPSLDVQGQTSEQIYTSLKTEEIKWYKEGSPYLDLRKKISKEQKQRILNEYSLNLENLKNNQDFVLFYLNQIRLLYIRASKSIYENILTKTAGSSLKPQIKHSFQFILDSYFGHPLSAVELSAKDFNETLSKAPWADFPWADALKINQVWQAKEHQGPRELDQFIYDIKDEYQHLSQENFSLITKSLKAKEREQKICCRSAMGCSNCPLNRRYFDR